MILTMKPLTSVLKGVVSVYNHWGKDLSDSMKALSQDYVKDIIEKHLISGKIHSIENQENEILVKLDIKSGIDYIREDNNGLQGIAARVQWYAGKGKYPFNTFTLRKKRYTGSKTEVEKRLHSIKNGYFYPAFTLQAYFDDRINNRLLSIAAIRTEYLYKLTIEEPHRFFKQKSDNEFMVLPWDRVEPSNLKAWYEVNNADI